MQSILIWMVFPADPSVGLSVKFSSMGWTEWMADLKNNRDDNTEAHQSLCVCFCFHIVFVRVSLTGPAYQTAGWIHLGWRIQLSVLTDSGTWWWGASSLSRTNGRTGPWACGGERITRDHFTIILLLVFQNKTWGWMIVWEIAMSANILHECWCAGLRFGHPACRGRGEEEESR